MTTQANDKPAPTEEVMTASGFLQKQADLEREAAEVLPGKFDACTYNSGYIHQPLYACLTCTTPPPKYTQTTTAKQQTHPAGMCYSCSIECHTGHEIIELFTKRNFRCDCGTQRLSRNSCQLKKTTHSDTARAENAKNDYNHNFWGFYCRCDSHYNPDTESCLMVQCYICSDWFHDRCIGILPDEGEYEDYVCRDCVATHRVLRDISTANALRGKVEGGLVAVIVDATGKDIREGAKAEIENEPGPQAKRARTECRLAEPFGADDVVFDLFLAAGWRKDLCTCERCMRQIEGSKLEYLLGDDDVVEPEIDDARGESMYETALKQLRTMDHSRAIDAASAYQSLSSQLREYLRPFAQGGKVVTREDISAFFEKQKAQSAALD